MPCTTTTPPTARNGSRCASGLFGTRVTLVPLRRADYTGNELRVPFDKVQLRNAPHHDPGNELSSTDEADLYRYDQGAGERYRWSESREILSVRNLSALAAQAEWIARRM